jgi:hypothetical protein
MTELTILEELKQDIRVSLDQSSVSFRNTGYCLVTFNSDLVEHEISIGVKGRDYAHLR